MSFLANTFIQLNDHRLQYPARTTIDGYNYAAAGRRVLNEWIVFVVEQGLSETYPITRTHQYFGFESNKVRAQQRYRSNVLSGMNGLLRFSQKGNIEPFINDNSQYQDPPIMPNSYYAVALCSHNECGKKKHIILILLLRATQVVCNRIDVLVA